jgi:hypothetical protein
MMLCAVGLEAIGIALEELAGSFPCPLSFKTYYHKLTG